MNQKHVGLRTARQERSAVWLGALALLTVAAAVTVGRIARGRPVLSDRPPLAVAATVTPPGAATPTTAPTAESGALVSAQDGGVRLLASEIGAEARYYTYAGVDGKAIAFFVLRSSDGVIRAAFDACDVCYPARLGYHQEGNELVCNNCGSRFPSAGVNVVSGGCNPAPLVHRLQGDQVVIRAADLDAGSRYF
jgi:hypothetical protein